MKRVLTALATFPLTLGLLGGPADASTSAGPPSTQTYEVASGLPTAAPNQRSTKPTYDYDSAIRESVWV
ncbi:MAG: hypothetical protein ACRDO7_12870, partial [Nocardioidaceae bacterium]